MFTFLNDIYLTKSGDDQGFIWTTGDNSNFKTHVCCWWHWSLMSVCNTSKCCYLIWEVIETCWCSGVLTELVLCSNYAGIAEYKQFYTSTMFNFSHQLPCPPVIRGYDMHCTTQLPRRFDPASLQTVFYLLLLHCSKEILLITVTRSYTITNLV